MGLQELLLAATLAIPSNRQDILSSQYKFNPSDLIHVQQKNCSQKTMASSFELKNLKPKQRTVSIVGETFSIMEYKIEDKAPELDNSTIYNNGGFSLDHDVFLYIPAVKKRFKEHLDAIKRQGSIESTLSKANSDAFKKSVDDLVLDTTLRGCVQVYFEIMRELEYGQNSDDERSAEESIASMIVIAKGKAPFFEYANVYNLALNKNATATRTYEMLCFFLNKNPSTEEELRSAAVKAFEKCTYVLPDQFQIDGF